jgi:hypothetical protein
MKVNFEETIHLKTEQELLRISKDSAFYSSEERYMALEELEKRGVIPRELAESKENLADSTLKYVPLDNVPPYEIYKISMLWVASYLGGPLAAGYVIATNFRAFGQFGRAKNTWIWTVVATIVIFSGIFTIPEKVLDAIPNMAIPLLYTLAAYFLMHHFQDLSIGTHLASGGRVFSWWRVILIGLTGSVITFAVILCVSLIL